MEALNEKRLTEDRSRRLVLWRWVPNLLLLGISIAVGLVTTELAVRWLAPQSVLLWKPGPFLQDGSGFFRLRPGHQGRATNRTEYEHSVRINAAGLRGPELPTSDEGICRVLAIGDSFTFGLGVEEMDVFHQVAARRLSAGSHVVESYNGGIPAIGVPQEVRWLERYGLQVDPDLVLITVFIGNDLRDANVDYDNWTVIDGQLAPPGRRKSLKEWLFNHVHLFALLKSAVPSGLQKHLRQRLGMAEPWSQRYAREVFMIYRRTPSPEVRDGLERTGEALDALLRLSGVHDFRVAATLIPDIVQVDDRRWLAAIEQLDLAPESLDPRQPNRLLRAAFEQRGIPVLDFTDAFVSGVARGEPLYYPTDRHWTAAGHRLAGQETVAFLAPHVDDCPELSSRHGFADQ